MVKLRVVDRVPTDIDGSKNLVISNPNDLRGVNHAPTNDYDYNNSVRNDLKCGGVLLVGQQNTVVNSNNNLVSERSNTIRQ